jgi:hypothetical protein
MKLNIQSLGDRHFFPSKHIVFLIVQIAQGGCQAEHMKFFMTWHEPGSPHPVLVKAEVLQSASITNDTRLLNRQAICANSK